MTTLWMIAFGLNAAGFALHSVAFLVLGPSLSTAAWMVATAFFIIYSAGKVQGGW
jgi:hypothetical protein